MKWFNILSNWDPYEPDATGRIHVAVANDDKGADMLGLNRLIAQGREDSDVML